MRKNKMMRLASVLLVLCLLTTSVISGTFAKYITQDSANDTARVAKFGVVATVSGDLFGATYTKATGDSITSYSLNGANGETVRSGVGTEFVVAPGTKNLEGLTLSVIGTPEVATKVTFDAAEEAGVDYADSEIYLAKGEYGIMIPVANDKAVFTKENIGNYYVVDANGVYKQAGETDVSADTKYELHDIATVAANYYPIAWDLDTSDDTYDITNTRDLDEVRTNLRLLFNTDADGVKFQPNQSNALSAVVTWSWAYSDEDLNGEDDKAVWDDSEADENIFASDRQDTILGHMMAYFVNDSVGTANEKVVVWNGTSYQNVYYTTVNAGTSNANNKLVVKMSETGSEIACLTVAFNARLTVEQVD